MFIAPPELPLLVWAAQRVSVALRGCSPEVTLGLQDPNPEPRIHGREEQGGWWGLASASHKCPSGSVLDSLPFL